MSGPTATGAAALLEQHQRRIDLITQCANEPNRTEFERKWLSVLRGCAAWFSTLPLSPQLYKDAGGAFRCTIETAFFAMRLAGGRKFGTNLPSEQRRRIEPQYNYAVFLCATCSRLDEPYRYFQILRDTDRVEWNPSIHGGLEPWLGNSPYRIVVRPVPLPVERMRTGMLAQVLIGSQLLAGLDGEVLAETFGAINPVPDPQGIETLLHKVVREAVNVADESDRKAQRGVFAPVSYTVPSAVQVAAELQPVVAPAPTPVSPSTPPSPSAAPSVPHGAPQAPAAADATVQEPSASPSPSEPAAVPVPMQAAEGAPPARSASTSPERMAASSTARAQSLHEAIGITGEPSPAAAPDQMPVDPTGMRATPRVDTREKPEAPAGFDDVLKGLPNSVRELFVALREDVIAGSAKVEWNDKGLVIGKRLIGSYGLASSTLVEHMRKRSLMVADGSTDITLAPRAGQLILERPA
ncbi:TraI domain-containing protein [Paraburkholderia strydomiana]|uniref:TraI domain-containing protein n=1 Tax=Paraburkholderia strydomiana TaxID=1245417 RepID=UPI001BED1B41|nr:TraI domain-containing protein [Paraburkholderia strydomiana]MBT2794004.1 TraI domain-containing protein [Paraburkholderia strydomiana]